MLWQSILQVFCKVEINAKADSLFARRQPVNAFGEIVSVVLVYKCWICASQRRVLSAAKHPSKVIQLLVGRSGDLLSCSGIILGDLTYEKLLVIRGLRRPNWFTAGPFLTPLEINKVRN